MNTLKLYDPYRVVDPTLPMPAPVLSRTIGGKFSGYSQLAAMTDDHYPIESNYWRNGTLKAWEHLADLMGAAYWGTPDQIIPPAAVDNFSWRCTYEIIQAAIEQAEKTPADVPAIVSAAHKFLADLQYNTARTHLDKLLGTPAPKEMDAITMSETLSMWFQENFDLIPEVEY